MCDRRRRARIVRAIVVFFAAGAAMVGALQDDAEAGALWDHVFSETGGLSCRGLRAEFASRAGNRVLRLTQDGLALPLGEGVPDPRRSVAWVSIPSPREGWRLSEVRFVTATVRNVGDDPAVVTLWAVGSHGWAAVGDVVRSEPGSTEQLRCDLRERYPDGTPKIDPTRLAEIRVMIQRTERATLEVSDLRTEGQAPRWTPPGNRLLVPEMTDGPPRPGRRVRYRLPGDDSEAYCAVYLPEDWTPRGSFPVIAEFPGNVFFDARACWSTGRPEQCVIGYGISRGRGAIWVSLPFVDRRQGTIAEAGFGSNDGDDTAAYTVRVIEEICDRWGGDRRNVVLSGFSRGAIACGYIGLRNDRIAGLWKAFVACQHYDGSHWRQSTMEGAVERARRFRGCAIFQIDNDPKKYAPVVAATRPEVRWTWERSGLGYHATAMFLDDRPMMRRLRRWFAEICTP
ncbi:MAG: hypothetical protein D6725_05875 [Planctomycetota bacterium]|nr:MAG: hypothetical protein D6725_05875 [Planctomycetota bacterium]